MKMFGIAAVAAVVLAAAATAAAAQNVGSDSGVAQPRRAVADHSHPPAKATKRPAPARSAGPYASAPAATTSRLRAVTTSFDGSWSVLIVSREGVCNANFRYGVEISNGNVINAGGAPVSLAGRVAPNGMIQVSVAAGDQRAVGVGRLSRFTGGGTWQGAGSGGSCAGIWQAERRG